MAATQPPTHNAILCLQAYRRTEIRFRWMLVGRSYKARSSRDEGSGSKPLLHILAVCSVLQMGNGRPPLEGLTFDLPYLAWTLELDECRRHEEAQIYYCGTNRIA